MKKYIISTILCISVGQLYPLTKAEVALKLTNVKLVSTALKDASEKMLGQSTQIMFESGTYPINPDGLKAWYYSIDSLKNLMSQYNTKKNPVWDSYFNKLEMISNDLINAIKITYNSMFSPTSSMTMNVDNAASMKEQLNAIITRISTITQAVTKGSSRSVQEAMIKDIIYQFGAQLRTIASAAIYGIEFAG
jgi:hypothetical protein